MQLQKITVSDLDTKEVLQTIWVGSKADAGKKRSELTASGVKRAQIETTPVDVPTNKAGLLEWLNSQ